MVNLIVANHVHDKQMLVSGLVYDAHGRSVKFRYRWRRPDHGLTRVDAVLASLRVIGRTATVS
ncbi:hypothetical protein [Paraburkholderia sacchari]|uniref:hypothetical protein n=1 Tax=Paraburkholderia sacchari TaxID=159450 RepID=UPI001BCA9BC5|nr:hypothetical protein [Paraburkholderia sacchari]